MKKTPGWRLLPGVRLKTATGSHATNTTGDVSAASLQSSAIRGPRQGLDVGQVIAKALSGAGLTASSPGLRTARPSVAGPVERGAFLDGSYSNAAGTRAWKLYVPASRVAGESPTALVVMLHGCTQSPADFATGTQMNRLAERDGFLVLYPAQPANANGSNCWNWFRTEDQQRERGEPSLIAGMTREIVSTRGVDPARVYVAGLSAGAAMAVILGATYPDVFAAVGAHSGLPYGAAHDVPSAFGAMKGGTNGHGVHARHAERPTDSRKPVRTIVFHGDQDTTVHMGNGAAIVSHAVDAHARTSALRAPEHVRLAEGARHSTRILHADRDNRPVVEHWIVHGAGHAWSGGDANGSYADPSGPCASEEMIRFFDAQTRAGAG